MNNLKVLCLSFRTPPEVRPQAILISKMIPEWLRQGVKPVILTYDNGGEWEIDASVYKISKFKINKFLNKTSLIRWILRRFYNEKIFRLAAKIIKDEKINLIFSFSNPQESNILGARLKERLGIKFIAHFSDPWYDNPFESFSPCRARKILKQEKKVIEKADKIIFVNNQTRELVMKKYPSDWKKKAEVISHCFNLADYPATGKERNEKIIFSHIGVFYNGRNPEIFFKALSNVFIKTPERKKKVIVKLVGSVGNYAGYSKEKVDNLIDEYNIRDVVEIIPTVEYKESLRLMKASDCLVVIDANIPNSPFLPSKLIDYAGSGNLILGITPEESPTRDFLNGLGYRVFNYEQVNELSAYLEKLIQGEIKINVNQDFLKQYDVCNTTAKLINIFKEILNR